MSDVVVYDGASALARYGAGDAVKSLAGRLMKFHPAAREVGEGAMLAAAQLALMYGANPLPGNNELHIWKNNKGQICIQLGIGFYTRLAEQQGGLMWFEQPRPMDEQERKVYGVVANDHAWITKGFRAIDWHRNKALSDERVWQLFGATGVGVASASEYSKAGRPLSWTAEKRARTDLYRRLFPAQLVRDDLSMAVDEDQIVIEGDVTPDSDINADIFGLSTAQPGRPTQDVSSSDVPPDELVIMSTAPGDFVTKVLELLPFYKVKQNLINTARTRGYASIPADANARLNLYRDLKMYAQENDAEAAEITPKVGEGE